MAKLIAQRLALGVLTLFGVSIIIFAATEILPGDVAEIILGQSATPESLASIREKLGLDQPAHLRFLSWLGKFLQGDLGTSIATGTFGSATTINEEIGRRLMNTVMLASSALLLALPLALVLAMFAAIRPKSILNRAVNVTSLISISFPEFFVAYILITIFAVQLRWFPAMATISPHMGLVETANRIALPVLTLLMACFAYLFRLSRACLTDVLTRPYVEMAVLKGLPMWRIVAEHALPNALGPIANVVVLTLASLIVGTVVIEVVFVYPGMGQYFVDAVTKRDVPVVQACAMVFASIYVGLNLVADFVAMIANPRLRYPR